MKSNSRQPQQRLTLKPSPKKQPPKSNKMTAQKHGNSQKTVDKIEPQGNTVATTTTETSSTRGSNSKKGQGTRHASSDKRLDSKTTHGKRHLQDESVVSAGEVSFQNRLTEIAKKEVVGATCINISTESTLFNYTTVGCIIMRF